MSAKIGVLIFPAGEINSVELHDALSTCVNIRLVGASSVDRHGEYVFERYISGVPKINESNFIEVFNELIDREQIDVIIPTHDDVALFLAENRDNIRARVLAPDYETALICRDKGKTYELFAEEEFCPQIYEEPTEFPVFIKPRRGQGGVGTRLLRNKTDIPQEIDWAEYAICEYLPGEEMTVDCFSDKDGNLQAVLPRSRKRVFGGVSVRADRENLSEEIRQIAETINCKLDFLGLWYFQIKKDAAGNWKLLEISARCAGTMCLSRAIGANLPLLSVYAAMGRNTEVFTNNYDIQVDRTLISRYKTDMEYDTVYIDLDDTILVNEKVHLPAIWFLYQCVNTGKKVVLLTRHGEDHEDSVQEVLQKHKIALDLFDEIIELPFDIPKYKYIEPERAIFIDNAYAERKLVHKKLDIPVFDVDGMEVLLDWRR